VSQTVDPYPPLSARQKARRGARKLAALLIGLACGVNPWPTDDARDEQFRFVRSRYDEDAREKFVGADAHADVTAVVVTYNSAPDISPLIDDLRVAALDRPVRVIVVDNKSADGTARVVKGHVDVKLIESRENLGYAGGINTALPFADPCDAILILNPDVALARDTVTQLLKAADTDSIGAVVPLMLDADGTTYSSLRREPSLTRALGDALLGRKIRTRPGFSSEIDARPASYLEPHDVDWATGAAVLIPASVAHAIGDWDEEFFMYSEETDYFRRIRDGGYRVRFEPSAVVLHRRGGSGMSPELISLMAVNRVRYVERHHGQMYSVLFRVVVALGEGLRWHRPIHRRRLAAISNRRRWRKLARDVKHQPPQYLSGPLRRGAVIVPAYNEAAVIKRTLDPLSQAAVDGYIEVVVVCNGCTDDSAEVARSVPGMQVIELAQGSKPAALNAGDEVATLWPRLYLDADIQLSATAVLAVLDRLTQGDVLAARPESRYDFADASMLVRCYYRARKRIPKHNQAMWGAGAYGLNEKGHQRIGAFPTVTGDDLYVDGQFDAGEKTVVATEPSVVKTPTDVKSLLAIKRRSYRGAAQLSALTRGQDVGMDNTGVSTAAAVVRTIRGPRSAMDALVYLGIALAARQGSRDGQVWERDESSRSKA